jgi:2-dehydro-3-deoxyphosphogalactonate aldolase
MISIDAILAAGAPPIVAILRGVRPDEAVAITDALVEAGIRLIEVPFNSPEPEKSIAVMTQRFGDVAAIGGGTVLTVGDVDRLKSAGGRLMVSPNINPAVIGRALQAGMEPMPGFMTPSEMFVALEAGARRLKLFPASLTGPAFLKALRDVAPSHAKFWAVGGTGAENLSSWLQAGAEGIGVGGSLYRAGDSAEIVGGRAVALVNAWRAAKGRA